MYPEVWLYLRELFKSLDVNLFIISGVLVACAMGLGLYLFLTKDALRRRVKTFDVVTTARQITTAGATGTNGGQAYFDSQSKNAGPRTATLAGLSDGTGQTALFSDSPTATDMGQSSLVPGFDESLLEGRYRIISELHGGGMSRVFLAENTLLQNQWVVKYLPAEKKALLNEGEILKKLNHISLPKIVDIFANESSVCIVESFVEGVDLHKVLSLKMNMSLNMIYEWAAQIADVLSYLHHREPYPIFHLDLKPSNIIVTHDNRLVLIDFGISKQEAAGNARVLGVTYRYAAPEQVKHNPDGKGASIIKERFGGLPVERMEWPLDARTDIYCLGLILYELATGNVPTEADKRRQYAGLKKAVPADLARIIKKCIELRPADRYQTTDELVRDIAAARSLGSGWRLHFARRAAAVLTAVCVLGSGGTWAGGVYVYAAERNFEINVALYKGIYDGIMKVGKQSSEPIEIWGTAGAEKKVVKDILSDEIEWIPDPGGLASVTGNMVFGNNIGETTLRGNRKRYGNDVKLEVEVVERFNPEDSEGLVDIAQWYQRNLRTEWVARGDGSGQEDGLLENANFISPESIAAAEGGRVYFTDGSLLRVMENGQVGTVDLPPYMTARLVRCHGGSAYMLTNEWESENGLNVAIVKIGAAGPEIIFQADAIYVAIEDFDFSSDGLCYFIMRNAGDGTLTLKSLNPEAPEEVATLCDLPEGTDSLAVGAASLEGADSLVVAASLKGTASSSEGADSLAAAGRGAIYLGNPETGMIHVYKEGELKNFAGQEGEKAFIDGGNAAFYSPRKLRCANGKLYVWDFNVLRRVDILGNGAAGATITVAGEADPGELEPIKDKSEPSEKIILPRSLLTEFAVQGGKVLITDPKRSAIWQAEDADW